jgi:hypothetical protein
VRKESPSEHNPIHASSDEALEKAARLAPLEESRRASARRNGKGDEGVLDDDAVRVEQLNGEERKSEILGLEPITLVIMLCALAFIGFIAYLISIEPAKSASEPAPATIERQP